MEITVETFIKSNIASVWKAWNTPDDIKQWNAASDDWHTTSCSVDLSEGGTFTYRMEAKDGSMGFDFSGTYTKVVQNQRIEYDLDDGRSVQVAFVEEGDGVKVLETFEADVSNSPELQRDGWQAILDNFARFVEG
jgi:uncharacterized protein YndB with AHSA1/START domain